MKGRKGREPSNDIFGGRHKPCQLVGIPRDGLWGLDNVAFIRDGGDLRDVIVDECLLDSYRMPVIRVSFVSAASSYTKCASDNNV